MIFSLVFPEMIVLGMVKVLADTCSLNIDELDIRCHFLCCFFNWFWNLIMQLLFWSPAIQSGYNLGFCFCILENNCPCCRQEIYCIYTSRCHNICLILWSQVGKMMDIDVVLRVLSFGTYFMKSNHGKSLWVLLMICFQVWSVSVVW